MAKYRHDRINEEMYRVAAEILRTVKDPRLNQAFVSVTGAEVSPDLKYAKIYYSHLQGDPKEIRRGLAAASGYIRGQLAKRLNMRNTPELTFVLDTSVEQGAHIAGSLNKITEELAAASPRRLLRMSRTARRAETAAGSRKDPPSRGGMAVACLFGCC